MDVVKILLAGLKHALKILSFVTEKIQKKKATEVRCLCFLHEIVLFFFFFFLLSYKAAGKTKHASSHSQRRVSPTRGRARSWPAPSLLQGSSQEVCPLS